MEKHNNTYREKKDTAAGVVGFIFLLIPTAWASSILIYAFLILPNEKPIVEKQWNGTKYIYVDSKRFCHFEKERTGSFTTTDSNPTRESRCINCWKHWSKHYQTQHTKEEIADAYYGGDYMPY